jgi:hypothetical protein
MTFVHARRLVLCGVFASALALATPALASVSTTTTEDTPVSTSATNPCAPENGPVTLTGTMHSQSHVAINDDNLVDVKLYVHTEDNYTNVKGVDQFGNTYVSQDTDINDFVFDLGPVSPFPFRFMNVDNVKFLSQNPDIPDFYAHFNVGFTVNANGTTTAVVDNNAPPVSCK